MDSLELVQLALLEAEAYRTDQLMDCVGTEKLYKSMWKQSV